MKTPVEIRRQAKLMGSAFEFVLIDEMQRGEDLVRECIGEVSRLERLLTEFGDDSQTSALNRSAGQHPIRVDEEVYELLKRCAALSRLTQGAFDITASILKKLYNFKQAHFAFPGRAAIRDGLARVGFDKVEFHPGNHVFLKEPGMHIGFGAIGKGYAADRVSRIMRERGVKAGVINASGDLVAWGCRDDGRPWTVGIADPANPHRPLLTVPVLNSAVATSGDYERFFLYKGRRYAHTIDPSTGRPVQGMKSVTVVSPSAELSDALATAVFVMGPDAGLHLIDQLPGTHAVLITDRDEILMSSRWKQHQDEAAAA